MIEELSRIVRDVGTKLMEWRAGRIFEGNWEGTQFKAKVDLMAHDALVDDLRAISPEIPIVSEESVRGTSSEICGAKYWLVDPIDGTASFVQGYPGFVTQVALMENHRPVISAIYAPVFDSLYIAEFRRGASLNGKKLCLTTHGRMETLIDNYSEPRGVAKAAFDELGFSRYIECGSISLKICRVADGSADLFIKDVPVRDWDIAAPQLVLVEASGFMTDVRGETIKYCGREHEGLIAAPSRRAVMSFAAWHVGHIQGGVKHNESSCRRSASR